LVFAATSLVPSDNDATESKRTELWYDQVFPKSVDFAIPIPSNAKSVDPSDEQATEYHEWLPPMVGSVHVAPESVEMHSTVPEL